MTDPHVAYVAAAYGFGALVLGGMVFATLADYSALKRALARFPQRGTRDR
ncbi:heme exporter protein CcmD [Methylocella sp.]